jgi:pimeloyl-ACP methyl ester carboxylesterase
MPTVPAPPARSSWLLVGLLTLACHRADAFQSAATPPTVDLHATAPDGTVLAGTLHYPAGAAPVATIILVHGSEPGHRGLRGYAAWVDAIVDAGYACLIVDKRGTGESEGEYVEAPDLKVPAADFLAWVAVVKRQPRVRADAIGMLGWSQAGWVAPLVASRSPDVAFMVLISGSGVSPLAQNIYDKTNPVVAAAPTAAQAELARAAVRDVMTYLVTGEGQAAAESSWGAVAAEPWFAAAYTGIPLMNRASLLGDPRGATFVAHNAYDPAPALRALRIPVLALFGSADRTVPVERSLAAMQATLGGPARFDYRIIPGGNHGLAVRDATGAFQLPATVRPMIFAWIDHILPPRTAARPD